MKNTIKKLLCATLVIVMCVTCFPISYVSAETVQIPEDAVEFNGHYYKVYEIDKTWDEARSFCEDLGGHLVTVTSEQENSFVMSIIGSYYCFMGATDKDSEGIWTWVTGETWDYTNWMEGEPNNGENINECQNHLAMYGENDEEGTFGKWDDGWREYHYFICEWEGESSHSHNWDLNETKTVLYCSGCNESYNLSPNKNFQYGRDNFSFAHVNVGSYDVSHFGLQYMNNILKLDVIALGANVISRGLTYIDNQKKGNGFGTWGGSCYGIACMDASFLSNLKTSNYGSDSVYGLSLDTKLKDSINIMMYSQASVLNFASGLGNNKKEAVSVAKSMSSNSYLPVLCYNKAGSGHAVNIIGVLPDDYDPNYYVLSIYDCNMPHEPQFIIISKDYKKAYLGEFYLNDSDTPIHALSGEIEIGKVLTNSLNSINYWAPGLSTSPLYSPLKSRTVNKSKEPMNYSQDEDAQIETDKYIRFLLASDEELTVTGDDGSYFVLNNDEITETNIDDIYYEYLYDFGVTKVVIPYTCSSYNVDSDNQYYASVSYGEKVAAFYCEKGGVSTYDCDGVATVDTRDTQSYSEICCYKNDIVAGSDTIGVFLSNSSSDTKVDFSKENPVIESNNIDEIDIKVQYDDEEFSIEDMELDFSEGLENFILKSDDEKIVVDAVYHEHEYAEDITSNATCTSNGSITYTCSCGDTYTETIEANGHIDSDWITDNNSTCSAEGSKHIECTVCEEVLKTEPIAKLPHNYSSVVTEATCEKGGYTTYTCTCGDTYTGDKTPAKGHDYAEGVCKNCGESKVENCSCNCHRSGFMGIIWKILRFFYKLFKINPVCGCGVSHY